MLTRFIKRLKEALTEKSEAARKAKAEKKARKAERTEALEKKRKEVADWAESVRVKLPEYGGYVEYEGEKYSMNGMNGIWSEYAFINARNLAENVMWQRLKKRIRAKHED